MKKVGKHFLEGTRKILSYKTVKMDVDGWVDAKQYLPRDYDVMYLKIKNKSSSYGWVSGDKWDGLRINPEDEIIYWKKKKELNI